MGNRKDEKAAVNLAYAPTHPRDLDALAVEMASRLRPLDGALAEPSLYLPPSGT
jgi:hypothetical protein